MAQVNFMASSESSARLPQIIEAAAQCFQERGYLAATLNDIATSVQLQKPTLYHYVKNKNELLFLVLQGTVETYNHALEEVSASSLNPTAKLRRAISQHISLQLEHPGTVTLFRDVEELEKPYRNEIRLALKRYRELLQAIVREGIAQGEFANRDPSMTALFILGAINFVHRWYRPHGPQSILEIAQFYGDSLLMTLRGVDPPV